MQNTLDNGHRWSLGEKQQSNWLMLDNDSSKRSLWSLGKRSPLSFLFRDRSATITTSRPSVEITNPLNVSTSTIKFVFLCSLWYTSSALSSNTGKTILNQFRYPVTLTFVQFGFIAAYCLLCMTPFVGLSKFKPPTKAIVQSTVPMAVFQVGGHIFSSVAIARIPVSTVHTIKALSPLFTVAAYALLFRVRYSPKTYISLLPLTSGVMMACSSDFSASNYLGLLSAFGSALVFVSSNIFFKKIMPSPSSGGSLTAPAHKLDKINLLFYSAGFAFVLMIPVWIYSDLNALLSSNVEPHTQPSHTSAHSIAYYFFWNGAVHFGQNIIAFAILSSTSPVTYSIASLVKRIAVILIAIAWFNQTIRPVQGLGIILTSVGLWMYNSAKGDVDKGEKKMRRVEAEKQMILPTTEADRRIMDMATESDDRPLSRNQNLTISTSISQNHTSLAPTSSHPTSVPQPSFIQLHNSPTNTYSYSYRAPPASSSASYPSPPPSLDSPTDDNINPLYGNIRPIRIAQKA